MSTPTQELFSGEKGSQQNALLKALILAAADYSLTIPEEARADPDDVKAGLYQYVEETPATSLVVEIVEALNHLGYQITVNESAP